jgi:hypothetical protein
MRIKSYFAPSVQTAIALARKEFGDDVTLVTSHVASLDNRHLGEYEVVFAIEEQTAVPEDAAPPAPAFHEMLQQAIVTPLPAQQDLSDKLEQVHIALVALGIESFVVRGFMTMLKALVPGTPATAPHPPVVAPALPIPEEPPAPTSRYSAAELAFMSSVSFPKEQGV